MRRPFYEIDYLHGCAREHRFNHQSVGEDNAPVVITRNRDQAVVMLSLDEYESLQETAHLLRSPANAKRLLESLEAIKRGKLMRKDIHLDE